MTSEIQNLDRAPYVGPRPFERQHADRFCARTREVNEAFSLIVAHPVLLIYAQSGAGKTSLVKAGLIPLLEQEELDVLPVARVYGHFPETHPLEEVTNPYVLNTLLSWAGDEGDIRRLNRLSLARFLGAGCPLLYVDDLKDPARLAGRLLGDQSPLTQYLSEYVSKITQRLLIQYDGSALPSARLQQAMVDDLNRVLKGSPLYSEERYPPNSLPEETLKLTR
jgi:hypothetical protein